MALASGGFLAAFVAASLLTGQRNIWLGDLAQLVPPLGYAALTLSLARLCTGQVRVFWNLNAIHAITWAIGQAVWSYYDVAQNGAPIISPSDPIFFVSSVPLAAALYGRPDRERPRWVFDIALLDIILIALFAAFIYIYFIVSIAITSGSEEIYHAHMTQLLNVRNLLLAVWAGWVWHSATLPEWRRVLGIYFAGLVIAFACGILWDFADAAGIYSAGSVWDLGWMVPYVLLALAAAQAHDDRLFAAPEQSEAVARLPVMSLIAIAMLVLIPITAEIARGVMDVPPATEAMRTRLALTMMIPFGVVVVLREFLSRRALLRAGQQLVQTREELAQKEKMAAVGQLVSGVAHELNNPLQGVLGYAELMALSQQDAGASEELRAIQENASRAAGIVRNLLTFAGRESATRSWQQINGVVQHALAARASGLRTAGIEVRLVLADRLPLVYLDSTRFAQVFENLIENAKSAIASKRGTRGGEIVIATHREPNPDRIIVRVEDNGAGFRTDDLTRLFDPFFTTKGVDGQGLGLSVCYGIVREHGGLIHARKRDDGGAVFVVEVPVTAEAYIPDQPPAAAESRPAAIRPAPVAQDEIEVVTRTPKALVVDDEESNAALVRRALEIAGYDVEITTLSRRALVMVERRAYDVVVADVRMPELNGPELYARVCEIRPEMARRFIFVTGDIDGEDTLEFLKRSRCGYFMKPFNLERLTTAVDMLVGGEREGAIG